MRRSRGLSGFCGLMLGGASLAADMVTQWNHVLRKTIRADSTRPGPAWVSRNAAIMHLAVYEAVNSIHRHYEPYYQWVPAAPSASADAAAAQAAARVLAGLYPAQSVLIQINLAASLRDIPQPGLAEGVAVGNAAADLVLSKRATDGSAIQVSYSPGTEPGLWRPDPLHPQQQALGVNWGGVQPFSLSSSAQFRSPAPPAMTTAKYAEAWSEVQRLGARDSATRTLEQTEIGVFLGYDRGGMGPPPILYENVAEIISEQRKFSMDDNARLFAMLGVAMADAGIACWESKYHYNYWRPIGGIREADTDGNEATVSEPGWEPLGASGGGPPLDFTPPFPAYPSGHATFGEAVFRMLELICGTDRVAFTVVSEEIPAAPRSYSRFSQASEENARSRIYLGVHWSFDDTEGRAMGRRVADQVFTTHFAPVLRTARHQGRMEIVWPSSLKNYEVQQNSTLQPLNWRPMEGAPSVQGELQMMEVPMDGISFYRLSRQMGEVAN